MSLFKHIEDNVSQAVAKAAAAVAETWHAQIQPFLKTLLDNVVHHEVEALAPLARQFVGQEVGALVGAIGSGDLKGFLTVSSQVAINTAAAAEASGMKVLATSLQAAVLSAVAGHPEIQAAYEAAKSSPAA